MLPTLNRKLTKPIIGIALALTVSYLLSLISLRWYLTFAIQPGFLTYPWMIPRLLTFWFVSREHIIHFLFLIAFVMLDRLVRDSWSRFETLMFVMLVNFSSALTVTVFYWITGNPTDELSISGNAALIAAVTVVACQFDPDRFLLGYNNTGLKSRHGFCVGFVLFFFLFLFDVIQSSSLLLYVDGFLLSWFYLRFLQHHPQRKYGDHRSSFAIAKFFPGPVEQWVAVPSNLVYHAILRSKICPAIERQSEIISTASFAVDIPGLTSDADRHRRIALKALNERLFNPPTQPAEVTEWPNLEESNSTAPEQPQQPNAQVQSVVVDLTGSNSSKPPADQIT